MGSESHTRRAFLKGVYLSIALSAALAIVLSHTRAGEWLEEGAYDARVRLSAQPAKADPRIVIIDIDNASLSGLQDKLGRWPWTRRVWTEVIRYVNRGNPRAIVVDAAFGGNESEAVDSEFASVIQSTGKTVLAFSFLSTELDRGQSANDAARLAAEVAHNDSDFGKNFGEVVEPHLPLDQLAHSAAGLGVINSDPDADGTIRREPLQFVYQGRGYSSLGLRAVQITSPPGKVLAWHKREGLFDSNYLLFAGKRIPLDEQGRMLLLWHGKPLQTYRRIPIWEVICSIYKDQCPDAEHSYAPEFFQDKYVLIGASAAGSYEARSVPTDSQAPGFFGHATTIDNLLQGRAMREFPNWLSLLLVFALVGLGGFTQFYSRSILQGSAIAVGILALYIAANYGAFRSVHWVFPIAVPCIAFALSYAGSNAARYITTGRELRQTRGVLERYVAPQLVDYVMSNLGNIHLNGDKRELTILISDVRNFTTMTEKSEPMELISLLDDYLSAMTEIIFKHNGIVDKFIGDGILAYWGAFTPGSNHAQEAAQAALEMLERVKQLNEHWAQQGKGPIAIGVGINTGSVIFGNIGRGKKIEFTVIGDAVNLAARLEGLNKDFHTSIVIGESTRTRLGDMAQVRSLGGVKVKGKTIETSVFELVGWGASTAKENLVSSVAAVEDIAQKS